MEQAIAKVNSFTELHSIAKAFIESGMFSDTKSVAAAIVKIQAGAEVGIKPFAAMTGIHIILGKPVIGAGIIASRIKAGGKYDYKVVEMSDKVCSIDFYEGKSKIGNSYFTIEDARKAQTKNIDKFPKNMLFARAISNGVKWFCPDVFDGPVYVPEEMNTTEDITPEVLPTDTTKETVKVNLTNKLLDAAISRIELGELDVYEKTLAAFNVTEEQKEKLETAFAAKNVA